MRRLQHVVRTCWLSRVLRGRRLDRNPLRRGCDRAATVMLGALLVAFLAGAPFAAQAAGNVAYHLSARAAQAQRAALHQVPATLLQAAASSPVYPEAGGVAPDVDARWRAPDGQVRTGKLLVPASAAAGSTVLVWTDRVGQPADAPLTHTQLVSRAQLAAGGVVGGLAVAFLVAGWAIRRFLDRRRLAAWDADWLANGPRWSPRR
jgi:hypothetical protein